MISLNQHAFMTTYTGVRFNLIEPRAEDVRIEDIAHALSNLCRFTGHTSRFYSVAEHSWLVSTHCSPWLELEGLLHDAGEAYVNDLSRPLKHHPAMSAYRDTEAKVMAAVSERFGLSAESLAQVKDIDNKIVCDEALALMALNDWAFGHPRLNITPRCWDPAYAKQMFLGRFNALMGVKAKAA